MSDCPELKIEGRTEKEISEKISDIRLWYGKYDGEKTIRLINTAGDIIGYATVEKLETEIRNGTLSEFIKPLLEDSPYIQDKELLGKIADGHTSESMRRERRKNNKENSFSKKLFKKK